MELQTLKVKTRQGTGTGIVRKSRRAGALPGVLYGGEKDAVSITVDIKVFETMLKHNRAGEHSIVQLEVEDDASLNTPALLKAVQHHPLKGQPVHIDFMRISLDKRITTFVPVKLLGQAPGIIEGGMMDVRLREVEVECLALDVPESLTVDVGTLHLNDSLHVSDIQAPTRVTILTEGDRSVVAVVAPRAAKETVEGEEAAQPEVITEKKPKSEA